IPWPAQRLVQPVVGRHAHAEPTHHLAGQLDVRLGSYRRQDANLHPLRGEGAGDEEAGQELGADIPWKARGTASKDPANVDGGPALSPQRDGVRAQGVERIEERTHRPFPEARVARQRRRPGKQRRDSREEAKGGPRVSGVDGAVGDPQRIAVDPDTPIVPVDISAKRHHSVQGRVGVFAPQWSADLRGATRQRREDHRSVRDALRRWGSKGPGDPRGQGAVLHRITAEGSIGLSSTMRISDSPSSIASRTRCARSRFARARMAGPVPVIPAARAPAARARWAGVSSTTRSGAYAALLASIATKW